MRKAKKAMPVAPAAKRSSPARSRADALLSKGEPTSAEHNNTGRARPAETSALLHDLRVHQIELDLARYLRPQLVQKAAAEQGFSVKDAIASINAVLDGIHRNEVTYEEAKIPVPRPLQSRTGQFVRR